MAVGAANVPSASVLGAVTEVSQRDAVLAAPEVPEAPPVADAGEQQVLTPDFAQINAHDRRDSQKWLALQPLGTLMAMRFLVGLLTSLMCDAMRVAGRDWELLEEARFLKKVTEGNRDPGAISRTFHLVIASPHFHENHFIQQLCAVPVCKTRWACVPATDHIIGFRSMAFRLLSRAGCCVHQNLHRRRAQFPVAMFKEGAILGAKLTRITCNLLVACGVEKGRVLSRSAAQAALRQLRVVAGKGHEQEYVPKLLWAKAHDTMVWRAESS